MMRYRVQRAMGAGPVVWYLITVGPRTAYAQCFDSQPEALAAAVEYANRDRQNALGLAA